MSLTCDDVINLIIKSVNLETQLIQFSVSTDINVFFQQSFTLSNVLWSLCTLLDIKVLIIVQFVAYYEICTSLKLSEIEKVFYIHFLLFICMCWVLRDEAS